ncbi:ACP S-malonyltransferase [Cupriavidus basilensis]|uniref:Malonyl CoA-acyl carrier protein transacylase n=1 Tax=Cupriavidus basilensis TaxID=68895 RepID=A0ABT6ASX8_9BURK|nr:ACP S-malonyltransferase [Cupriavidus basilensis]MDF3835362.1 ACP S-malonyltransferase [Cupriavidus basilensis]
MEFRIAHVFPGQGSQAVGMLDAWSEWPVVRHAIEEASDALGFDMWKMVASGSSAQLADTVNTQPIVVAASVALFRAWSDLGGQIPMLSAGHSVGEIAALTAAGAMTLTEAMHLVRVRARAMAEAVPHGGGMAAVIGLEDAVVRRLCEEAALDDVLEPANFNALGQVVVAGHLRAIERLKPSAKREGAKMVMNLPVSGPFHSSMMGKAMTTVHAYLSHVSFSKPAFPVIHNVDHAPADTKTMVRSLSLQLIRPVDWVGTMTGFQRRGVTRVFEIGPGEVLTNLNKRISPTMLSVALNTPAAMEKAMKTLL